MKKHVHLIGIGGSGLSAIARFLLETGHTVSGSDQCLSPFAQNLVKAGIQIFVGHKAENIQGADVIIRSSAIPDTNPEVIAARQAGIPVMKRSEYLGDLMAKQTRIAIAGTHGKTTTTAMLAWTLVALGMDPSFIIGGVSKNLGTNAHASTGSTFVIEADEFDRMFMGLKPDIIVLTSMEYDHPDCFPTPEAYQQAFQDFIRTMKPGGTLVYCQDSLEAATVLRFVPNNCQIISYGLSPQSRVMGYDLQPNLRGGMDFRWKDQATPSTKGKCSLQIPGVYNVLNTLATLAVVNTMDINQEGVARALLDFQGTIRRFDIIGYEAGVTVIDDYAHHPTEISATLAATRKRFPNQRVFTVWQPHTSQRTLILFQGFMDAFKQANALIITEVYAARETTALITGAEIAARMKHPNTRYIPSFQQVTEYLLSELRSGDVLLILSAGDANLIGQQVLLGLKQREKNDVHS